MANVEVKGYNPPRSTAKENYSIEIHVYFDGTKNNKNNTNARNPSHARHADYKSNGTDKASSYQNDWSNVARLWEQCKDTAHRIYIEGIGTADYKEDSTLGYAIGMGETGVRFKVRKGCEKVAELIEKKMKANAGKELERVNLNVFGFSRGAAAARNFVAELVQIAYRGRYMEGFFVDRDGMIAEREMPASGHLGYALKKKGITLKTDQLSVRFLGVFDTVSSHGASFSNDVSELRLNVLTPAKKIVHLTAIDEIRENFSLTRVPKNAKSIEKDLPGVHSDIGGSYLSGPEIVEEIETSWTSRNRLNPYIDRLVEEGWYNRNDLTVTGGIMYWALRGEKAMVYKEYSFLPLHFMGEFSVKDKVPTNLGNLVSKYSVNAHPTLVSAKSHLHKYVFEGAAYPYGTSAESSKIKELHKLRLSYFHRSATREGIGMDPNNDWRRREF